MKTGIWRNARAKLFVAVSAAGMALCLIGAALAENLTLNQLSERVAPGVVLVVAQDETGKNWIANGSVIDASGTILTSYHVIAGKRQVYVQFPDGEKAPLEYVIGYDVLQDLVIMTVHASDLAVVPLGDAETAAIGERLYIVSSSLSGEKTLKDGLLSARQVEFGSTWLLVAAAVGPGTSGSPLVNQQGEVIGVVSSQRVDDVRLTRAAQVNQIQSLLARGERIPGTSFLDPRTRPMQDAFSRGLQAFAEGRAREAIQYLEPVITVEELRPALIFLGASYLEAGEYAKAIDYLRKGLAHFPAEPSVYRYMGRAYVATGAHRDAIAAYQKYIQLESQMKNPNYELMSATHLAMGYSYLALAEFEQAFAQVDAIRQVGDERVLPDAYLLEGLVRNCQADLQAAYQCVEQLRALGKHSMADQLLREITSSRRRR